ncbi:DUF3857 and transglutaminase domain-containing protein [Stenotrophomonas sp. Marseille-Q4652]|uniref:DUF3857 domain-containing transglutaminase family protein n=1 Tax=Stenotrophomonas sp. Marseille-Q4652 TaxID=2866595 RepID=UPI001CE455E7|nr:DUF3857 and transglutaminase domain-containing protein [Stenotrophomonas sp. Marseille-Q4652]
MSGTRWLLMAVLALWSITAPAQEAAPVTAADEEPGNHYSVVRYRSDYEVRADASSVRTEEYEIQLHTKAGVDQFSQVRLDYSERMEALEVLAAYSVTPDGHRRDVPPERIYTQESYSSASAAMYADRKVRVLVFPNLSPGTRIVYRTRRSQNQPYFPGYFGLWETFSVYTRYDDAQVSLVAPAGMALNIHARDVEGGSRPTIRDGKAHWQWHHRNLSPMKAQNWSAAAWEFSPIIMASTYRGWSQMGTAYHLKAAPAAEVTPEISALATRLTLGIEDRREQAAALYRWVAQNIRYVAVYLGNGGLEPNSATEVLGNHYGDCKDHVALLQALLAARGIDSTPVLIGAGGGPTLPPVPVLGRFNHAINYLPEFDLYLDATSPYARFGQLPAANLGAPVVHTRDGKLARTPANDASRDERRAEASFVFERNGDVSGQTRLLPGDTAEMGMRSSFARLTGHNRGRVEESILASSGFSGSGRLEASGSPQDLTRPFTYGYRFQATDHVDFDEPGGLQLPQMPGADSFRDLHARTSSPAIESPFHCTGSRQQERYELQFPDSVPVVAVPRDIDFSNAAGRYSVRWRRDGSRVVAEHELEQRAVRGEGQLCQPQDYLLFRELYQQVRRGFRSQVIYGDLGRVAQPR